MSEHVCDEFCALGHTAPLVPQPDITVAQLTIAVVALTDCVEDILRLLVFAGIRDPNLTEQTRNVRTKLLKGTG